MHTNYSDILKRIDEQPLWFDENAVPRYDPFHPQMLSDIYADEAALVLIMCQSCHKRFKVAMSVSIVHKMRALQMDMKFRSIRDSIKEQLIFYGDPPNIQCCPSGPTMSSETISVLEYWYRDFNREWMRNRSYERSMED